MPPLLIKFIRLIYERLNEVTTVTSESNHSQAQDGTGQPGSVLESKGHCHGVNNILKMDFILYVSYVCVCVHVCVRVRMGQCYCTCDLEETGGTLFSPIFRALGIGFKS